MFTHAHMSRTVTIVSIKRLRLSKNQARIMGKRKRYTACMTQLRNTDLKVERILNIQTKAGETQLCVLSAVDKMKNLGSLFLATEMLLAHCPVDCGNWDPSV